MSPEPAQAPKPHQAEGLPLDMDTVAAFLRDCGLHKAAGVLREEAASAMPVSNEAIAHGLNRLAVAVLGVSEPPCCASAGTSAYRPPLVTEFVQAGKASASTCGSSTVSRLDDGDGRSDDGQAGAEVTLPPPAAAAAPPAPDEVAMHLTQFEAVGDMPPSASATLEPPHQQLQAPLQWQPPERSAHYDPHRASCPIDGQPDEYRDDADPGYRILNVSEPELLADMQERYREQLLAAFAQMPPPQQPAAGGAAQPAPAPAPALAQGAAGDASASVSGIDLDASSWGCAVETMPEPGRALPAPQAVEQPCGAAGPHVAALETAGAASLMQSTLSASVTSTSVATQFSVNHDTAEPAQAPVEIPKFPEPLSCDFPHTGAPAETSKTLEPPVPVAPAAEVAPAQAAAQVPPVPYALAATRKPLRQGGQGPKYRHPPSSDQFYPAEFDGVVYDCFPLKVVYERNRTGFEETKEFPILMNSIIAARYQVLAYLGSAAFSRAVQCLDLHTGDMVCMKIIKNDKDFVDQSLDEIKLLSLINANCDNIDEKHCLRMIDCFYHKEHLIIVTELLRDNLYEFSKFNREHGEEPYFTLGHLQRITNQLLTALDYIHSLWLVHCDLKPENILVKSYSRCEVKLIDFGSSCFVDDRLSMYVQSRSYRAPEVLLGLPYTQKIDVWSLGCVVAELWTGFVLFGADAAQSLLARIAGIIGPFPRQMLAQGKFVPQYFTQDGRLFRELEPPLPPEAGVPPELHRRIQLLLPKRTSLRQRMRTDDGAFLDFLASLLQIDPELRPTSREALEHPWLAAGRYSDGL